MDAVTCFNIPVLEMFFVFSLIQSNRKVNLQITLEDGRMRKDTLGLIQDAIDYMEENLKAEIGMSELSQRAGYSEYHFC